jgi:hypothetical protein
MVGPRIAGPASPPIFMPIWEVLPDPITARAIARKTFRNQPMVQVPLLTSSNLPECADRCPASRIACACKLKPI